MFFSDLHSTNSKIQAKYNQPRMSVAIGSLVAEPVPDKWAPFLEIRVGCG